MEHDDQRFATRAITTGENPATAGTETGDVVTPIHLAATFARTRIEEPTTGYSYGRTANPTRDVLDAKLATLENGEHALSFSAGMGAIGTVALAFLQPGDHVVAFDTIYGGTRSLFDDIYDARLGVDIEYVDATDTTAVRNAVTDDTTMVWMETITNPVLKLCDINAISAVAADHHAVFAIDNTFASPYFCQPLDLGADIVVHSTTKYLNGHSDVIGGATVTNSDDIRDRLLATRKYGTGAIPSPFDAYLVNRGIKTLPIRMERHQANGHEIAAYLEAHDHVERVYYPGLDSHPQHDLATEQLSGYGGMLSFEVDGGQPAAKHLLEAIENIPLAVSLGGVETLIAHAQTMVHDHLDADTLESMGISDALIRLSVGLEDPNDIIQDLDKALDAVAER